MSSIHFQKKDVSFQLPFKKVQYQKWIEKTIDNEAYQLIELSFVFTSDESLLAINQEFLKHNTYTDIITFDYSDTPNSISGEIIISIDRVKENAKQYEVSFLQELSRVMIHGVLHLMGYQDKTSNQKVIMRKKEDACISLLKI